MTKKPREKSKKSERRVREIPIDHELAFAQVRSGIGLGEHQNQQLQKQLGNPLAFVTEKEWAEIKETSGLPDGARLAINQALRRYWAAHMDELPHAGLVDRLRSITAQSEELLATLHSLDKDAELTKRGATDEDIKDLDAISEACDSLARCCVVLEGATRRLNKGGGRKSFGPLKGLIADLDAVLRDHTGTKLGLSRNRMPHGGHRASDYVWAVCKIAHLSVARSTIETRLGEYVSDRDRLAETE